MTARSEARATVMLVIVTALWGLSFIWTKAWQEASRDAPGGYLLAGLTLIGLRMPLALLLLGLWQPRVVYGPTRREHAGGAALGTIFFVGFVLQTWGLAYTTPALSAFFTSLCSAWAPLIALVVLREKVAPLTLIGLVLALAGCGVLVDGWNLRQGEWLTVAASLLFAGQLLVLDRLGKRLEPTHLTASYLAITAALAFAGGALVALGTCGVGVWMGWTVAMLSRMDVLTGVLYQAVFATALAFHWMNSYQPVISPARAALIYLLEPVFTSVFSTWWGHDELTVPLVLGGVLILGGNLLVELPRLMSAWRRAKSTDSWQSEK